jgi:hypothetical protein
MKKLVLMLSLSLGLNAQAASYTQQVAKLLGISTADIYAEKVLVEVPARGSTPALTTIEFSYDLEEYSPAYGYDVYTYDCVATAANGIITADMLKCELNEGILVDEY